MNIAVVLLPVGLTTAGGILTGKDANNTGADDAVGQICIALAPVIPDLLNKGAANANATLKAMRAIEQVAHAYRVQVEDPTLVEGAAAEAAMSASEGSARS